MAVLTLGSVSATNSGPSFISGTVNSGIIPVGVSTKDVSTILSDDSDVTYFAMSGGNGLDQSQASAFASAVGRVPSNCTIAAVNLNVRMRNNNSVCTANPIAELWTVWLGGDPGFFISTLTLTS